MQVSVSRPQLVSYVPTPGPETPAGYSYQDRLQATPGNDLDEIRAEGFKQLNKMGRSVALAGTGSAVTRGAAFGLGIAAAVRVLSGSVVSGMVVGGVAAGCYLAHRGLEAREQSLKESSREQVEFLRDLDQAQEKLTGVPAPYWIYV